MLIFQAFQFPGAMASRSYPKCAAMFHAGEKSCRCYVGSRLCSFLNPLEPPRNSLAKVFSTSQTSCVRIACSAWHDALKLFSRRRPLEEGHSSTCIRKMSHNTWESHPVPGHCIHEVHINEMGKHRALNNAANSNGCYH